MTDTRNQTGPAQGMYWSESRGRFIHYRVPDDTVPPVIEWRNSHKPLPSDAVRLEEAKGEIGGFTGYADCPSCGRWVAIRDGVMLPHGAWIGERTVACAEADKPWRRPAASENTIEQARAVAADALQHASVGGMHADADGQQVVDALAARGLLVASEVLPEVEQALLAVRHGTSFGATWSSVAHTLAAELSRLRVENEGLRNNKRRLLAAKATAEGYLRRIFGHYPPEPTEQQVRGVTMHPISAIQGVASPPGEPDESAPKGSQP
jgi:hypothetical protein